MKPEPGPGTLPLGNGDIGAFGQLVAQAEAGIGPVVLVQGRAQPAGRLRVRLIGADADLRGLGQRRLETLALAAGGQVAQEIGAGAPGNVNYVTYTLSYNSTAGTATLSDSINGLHGATVSTSGSASQDRISPVQPSGTRPSASAFRETPLTAWFSATSGIRSLAYRSTLATSSIWMNG